MGITLFERFFHPAAGIKVDRNDLRRFREFVDEQIDSIAIAGRDAAKWNGRDVIEPQDLPIRRPKARRHNTGTPVDTTLEPGPSPCSGWCPERGR
jgi:hypothetical protein